MLEWRLEAYRRWLTMTEPTWARVDYPKIDYQDLYYYSAPKPKKQIGSLDEIDPEILKTYEKLGIPLREVEVLEGVVRAGARAQDRGRRRVRLGLGRHHLPGGAEGGRRDLHADLGGDPRASRAGAEISRHGRADLGQFLRDAELGGVLRRLVRLRAAGRALPDGAVDLFPHQRAQHRPVRAHADHRRQGRLRQLSRRLHRAAARREPAARRRRRAGHARRCRDQIFDGAELVSRRFGRARAASTISSPSAATAAATNSKISWTQVETGSAITWKYPSCILRGDNSRGEFYSIAISNGYQQVDSGTKMMHLGKNTHEPHHLQGHRGRPFAEHLSRPRHRASQSRPARATSPHCDSLADRRQMRRAHRALYRGEELVGRRSSTRRPPRRSPRTCCSTASSAGCRQEEAVGLVVNGFVKDVLQQLPMEFAVEAQKLISISLEGSVG